MANLIESLKKEHELTRKAFARLAKAGKDQAKFSKLLDDTKKVLTAHFAREDAELYCILSVTAQTDSRLRILLGSFSQETIEVSRQVRDFFAKPGPVNLDRLRTLIQAVETRMKREEAIFFPEYERVVDFKILPQAA